MLPAHMLALFSKLRRLALAMAALGALALVPAVGQALPILPGDTALAAGEADPVGGALVAGTVDSFTSPTFSGTLTSSVIAGDLTNPYGGLTFTYLLTNDAVSSHDIGRATFNGFVGFATDASYQTPAGGLAPTLVDRSSGGGGDTVGFSFLGAPFGGGTLAPGAASALFVIQTDAAAWTSSTASVIDGSVTSAAILAPSPVPEPASALMFLSGLLLVSTALRREQL